MRNWGLFSSPRIASKITSAPVSLLGYNTTKLRPERRTADTTCRAFSRSPATPVVTGWYNMIPYSANGIS